MTHTTMPDHKLYLCIITNDKEYDNIDELTRDVYTYFDGICAVVHPQGGDNRVKELLETRKGCGFVIERPFVQHHGHSMNEWLFDKRIKPMDICVIRDSLERIKPEFAKGLKTFAAYLLANGVFNLYQHSKLLLFRRWHNQMFINGLHWGLINVIGQSTSLEKIAGFEKDEDCAYSVRNQKRPKTHRYWHEVSYILDYNMNGNHLALFHPNKEDLAKAEIQLYQFTQFLEGQGVTTCAQLIEYLKTKPLQENVRVWLNNERPFRNLYRYYILGHTNEEIEKDENVWKISQMDVKKEPVLQPATVDDLMAKITTPEPSPFTETQEAEIIQFPSS